MTSLRESAVVGAIEGVVLLGEFLFVATVGSVLSSTVQRTLQQVHIPPILEASRYITPLFVWLLSPLLVTAWLCTRYQYLWREPRHPIPYFFGLGKLLWWARPSLSCVLLSLILGGIFVFSRRQSSI